MSFSINPITKKEYDIPEKIDDRENIDHFIEKNINKKVVVVQGLGFVGAVMSLICSNSFNSEYAVIGVDLPNEKTFWKIKSLNEGIFPLSSEDSKVEELYKKSLKNNSFYATYDEYAYSLADVIIVDINLDVMKESDKWKNLLNFEVDLSGFEKAIKTIGDRCRPDTLILVETTVPPGTCQKIIYPIIKKCFSERGIALEKIIIGHSYERVMPGKNYVDSIRNYYRVFSGIDNRSAEATEAFLKTIIKTDEYPLTRLGNTNATEMAKVLENSYRAINIAFIVEWTRFAEEAGVNIYEVVKAIRMRSTHSNIMLPGIGVGGYCLPKDPLLASWSRQNLFGKSNPLNLSEESIRINDRMPFFAFEFLKNELSFSLENKKVILLGVSYRQEVGDTRYTPVELLYDCLEDAKSKISIHDPYVSFWEEKNTHVTNNLDSILDDESDVIIISTGHPQYKSENFIEKLLNMKRCAIYDTIGIYNEDMIKKMSKKHRIIVLGRGDL